MNTEGHKVCDFLEGFLTLGGSWYGQPFEVLPFQREFINDMYLLDDEGKRLRRTYLLGWPRKTSKSQTAAALALYHLVAACLGHTLT